ncbi:MAG: metal-sensitive transcriptional regulator [Candidatus Omnitrophota bacterium]
MINQEVKEGALLRLKRIEGQIRGVQNMVEEERYCIDIINQITAVCKALEQVGLLVMKRHLESCVAESIRGGKANGKIKELVNAVEQFIK